LGAKTQFATPAAVFTETPNYFATLQWPQLTPGNESFATAYFPSIAEATDQGFTYRLLMKGIARLRLQPAFGVSEATSSQLQNPNTATLVSAAAFRAGNQVARLVPRSQSVVTVDDAAAAELNLHATPRPLNAGDVTASSNPSYGIIH
jgi:hypothetical protein